MKTQVFFTFFGFLILVLNTGCVEAGGTYVTPPDNAPWTPVPVTSSLAFGLNIDGAQIAQIGSESVTISIPGTSQYTLKPSGDGFELVQGLKSWSLFKSYSGRYAIQLEFGNRKFVFRKNPDNPKYWQVYKP